MPSIILGNGGRATSKRHLDYNAIDFMTVTKSFIGRNILTLCFEVGRKEQNGRR